MNIFFKQKLCLTFFFSFLDGLSNFRTPIAPARTEQGKFNKISFIPKSTQFKSHSSCIPKICNSFNAFQMLKTSRLTRIPGTQRSITKCSRIIQPYQICVWLKSNCNFEKKNENNEFSAIFKKITFQANFQFELLEFVFVWKLAVTICQGLTFL